MKLSILIPTIFKRIDLCNELLENFNNQILSNHSISYSKTNYQDRILKFTYSEVEIILHLGDKTSIGTKRNTLLQLASGKYLCFFDDDDKPSDDYIETILSAIESGPDCVSLRGIMTTNGENPEIFEHSLKYSAWKTTENTVKYERYPNHLNCIRASIAKQIPFPDKNYGEDFDWSTKLHESGLLKTEYYTDKVLYHYKYLSNK